ncbi:MAG TPA: sialidase family protein, partial [Clostridia bacterium]|nr:sialidase family protein [Clostridia bacterium]
KNQGLTWSPVTRSTFEHVTSRFFIGRLLSGRLLWIRHGQPHERLSSRRALTAFLSEDDGLTWSGGLLIDPRESVSYPDAAQSSDGRVFVIYDRERHDAKEILMVELTEERILSGQAVQSQERRIVNKANGIKRAFVP